MHILLQNDGGARLLGYIIEKKDSTKEEWTEVANLIKDINHLVSGLFEGHEYEFRVSAVNQNGQGPPLMSDGSIVARLPFDPPLAPGKPEVRNPIIVHSYEIFLSFTSIKLKAIRYQI